MNFITLEEAKTCAQNREEWKNATKTKNTIFDQMEYEKIE